ncbi:MAG: DUF1553 domain-containing protein, partial [Planctomycetaceae bacterium]|nr:DUF1553 domain-containing protein [Planctomycetaceae bacterium]
PELLDWLASELMDHGWSLKHIHRLIVTSATYQQQSTVTPQLAGADPENRLLARMSRMRLPGEGVRDVFLDASGLLNEQIGGPPVYPPAPTFLFQPPVSYGPKAWDTDTDGDQYRRALYTFRFRSVPYPVLQNFDTPRGDVACVRRNRSNTPLQALTTLNEDLFVECAQQLAVAVVNDASFASDEQRLIAMFERVLSRSPESDELESLRSFVQRQQQRFGDPSLADQAALLAGTSWASSSSEPTAGDRRIDVPLAEQAAWTAVARVILNLDETITRP